jgi:hypothetical protein
MFICHFGRNPFKFGGNLHIFDKKASIFGVVNTFAPSLKLFFVIHAARVYLIFNKISMLYLAKISGLRKLLKCLRNLLKR